MATEIERKFLLKNDNWKKEVLESFAIKQGYLNHDKNRTVRVRLTNKKGFITIKGKTEGISRSEFEYEIPLEDAISLLKICRKPLIEKVRSLVKKENHIWEIDEFEGDNLGLTIAEIEITNKNEDFSKPQWLGEEVSEDTRYFNSYLSQHPFNSW